MTAAQIADLILSEHPFMFRNNRGRAYDGKRFIRFGIPQPSGRRERDTDMKGSDYIGFIDRDGVPVFASIEVKTMRDRIKPGQIKWLRFVADHGGIAQVWQETECDTVEVIDIGEIYAQEPT